MDTINLVHRNGNRAGGRNGHTQPSDTLVMVDLSSLPWPGKPGTTTPEDLFAAGYAACFAVRWISPPSNTRRTRAARPSRARRPSDRAKAEASVWRRCCASKTKPGPGRSCRWFRKYEKICPYSHATRNNVNVTFEGRRRLTAIRPSVGAPKALARICVCL